jgi:CheY-like chemotaxis protein
MTRVLIDEFDSIMGLGLRELLESDGIEVLDQESGSVLDVLASRLPDVVVLDLDAEDAADRAQTICHWYPTIQVVGCSATGTRMRIFPRFSLGDSFTVRLSPEEFIKAVL